MAVPDPRRADHPHAPPFERYLSAGTERLVHKLSDEHAYPDATLEVITTAAVELIPETEHAGITLITRGRVIHSRAATSELPRQVDDLPRDLRDGPCVQSLWEHDTVLIDDMDHEDRWPTFAPAPSRWALGRCSCSGSTPPRTPSEC